MRMGGSSVAIRARLIPTFGVVGIGQVRLVLAGKRQGMSTLEGGVFVVHVRLPCGCADVLRPSALEGLGPRRTVWAPQGSTLLDCDRPLAHPIDGSGRVRRRGEDRELGIVRMRDRKSREWMLPETGNKVASL